MRRNITAAWFLLPVLIAMAGCSNNPSGLPPPATAAAFCKGCNFLLATTQSSAVQSIAASSAGSLGAALSAAGPAGSIGIVAIPPAGLGSVQGSLPGAAYISDPAANAVRVYTVSGTDGSLAPGAFGPYVLAPTGGAPGQMQLFRGFLYVISSDGNISVFDHNADFSLTPLPGSPFAAPAGMSRFCAFSSAGNASLQFLYAIDPSAPEKGIAGFSIALDGSLAPLPSSPFPLPAGAGTVSLGCPLEKIASVLYVGMQAAGAVAAFAIASDGTLSAVPGSPFAAGHGTSSLVQQLGFLYAQNNADATVSGFSVGPNGALVPLPGSPFASAAATGALTPSGSNSAVLYLPDAASSRIFAFQPDAQSGALTPLAGSPFPLTQAPVAVFYLPFD